MTTNCLRLLVRNNDPGLVYRVNGRLSLNALIKLYNPEQTTDPKPAQDTGVNYDLNLRLSFNDGNWVLSETPPSYRFSIRSQKNLANGFSEIIICAPLLPPKYYFFNLDATCLSGD